VKEKWKDDKRESRPTFVVFCSLLTIELRLLYLEYNIVISDLSRILRASYSEECSRRQPPHPIEKPMVVLSGSSKDLSSDSSLVTTLARAESVMQLSIYLPHRHKSGSSEILDLNL
jgi:hypothetical protein